MHGWRGLFGAKKNLAKTHIKGKGTTISRILLYMPKPQIN